MHDRNGLGDDGGAALGRALETAEGANLITIYGQSKPRFSSLSVAGIENLDVSRNRIGSVGGEVCLLHQLLPYMDVYP